MDVGAFVQENRRWLIGCGIGGILFLIGKAVIGSVYDDEAINSQISQLRRSSSSADGVYDRAVLDAARAESEQLAGEKQRLQQELAFRQSAKYQLEGKGDPGTYLFKEASRLKAGILAGARDRDVQVLEKDVVWPTATGVDEIRGVLFGLELLDEVSQRLFAAHDGVRQKDQEAAGLRAIVKLSVEPRANQRSSVRSTRPGDVVVSDHLVQEKVSFRFQSDAATAAAFLELWRSKDRTLVLDSITATRPPDRIHDPVTVNGTLIGIAFKETN